MKISQIIILGAIFLLGLFLRSYQLDSNPPGLYIDEISIATNAYTISTNLKDEFGVFLPFWFEAFGEYKLPGYIYTTAIFILFLGNTYWSVRLPSVIAGALGTLLIFEITKLMFPKKSSLNQQFLPLITALLWAISPWSIQFSRGGFEANLGLTFLLAGIYFLFSQIRPFNNQAIKNVSLKTLVLSGLFFGLSIATYNSFRFFGPVFMIWFSLANFKKLKNHRSKIIQALLIVMLLTSPIIWNQFNSAGLTRATSESVFKSANPLEIGNQLIINTLDNLDFNYLFFLGDQQARHSVGKQGMHYFFQLPLILLGLIYLAKKKLSKQRQFLLTWFLIGIIPSVITTPSPHSLRTLIILPVWIILSGLGALVVFEYVNQKVVYRKVKISLGFLVILIVSYSLLIYQVEYYTRYRQQKALDWGDGNLQAVAYIKANHQNYDQVFIHQSLHPNYLAFHLPIEPMLIQSAGKLKDANSYQLGKFIFFNDLLEIEKTNTKKMILVPFWNQQTKSAQIIQQINMINGDPIYHIWEAYADF